MRIMRFVSIVALCAGLFLASACGRTEIVKAALPTSPSEIPGPTPGPTPAPTPGPTPTPTPGLRVQFNIDEAVSSIDRQIIEDSVPLAQELFRQQFQREIRNILTITARAIDCPDPVFARLGSQIDICSLSPGWLGTGTKARKKTMGHELFHILQQQNAWPRDQWWLVEGSAEYVGYALVISRGILSYQDVLSCAVDRYFSAGGHSLPSLDRVDGTVGSAYSMGWLAWHRLLGGIDAIPKLSAGLSGLPFETAYGMSIETFHADFASYRLTLTPRVGGLSPCHALSD